MKYFTNDVVHESQRMEPRAGRADVIRLSITRRKMSAGGWVGGIRGGRKRMDLFEWWARWPPVSDDYLFVRSVFGAVFQREWGIPPFGNFSHYLGAARGGVSVKYDASSNEPPHSIGRQRRWNRMNFTLFVWADWYWDDNVFRDEKINLLF